MQRTRLVSITVITFILIFISFSTLTHYSFHSPTLDVSDPNHFHYSPENIKLCTEKHDCPTLEQWLSKEVEVGHGQAVADLLKAGADGNAILDDGMTALHAAVAKDPETCVKALLKAGVDVNTPSIEAPNNRGDMFTPPAIGWTALHISAIVGNEKIVKLLLANKADITATSIEGCTALHRAAQSAHDKVAKILIDAGADVHTR